MNAGILGYVMYRDGQQFYGGDGIVKKGVENTIDSIARLGRDGMRATNDEIIRIMLERESRDERREVMNCQPVPSSRHRESTGMSQRLVSNRRTSLEFLERGRESGAMAITPSPEAAYRRRFEMRPGLLRVLPARSAFRALEN